MPKPPSSKLFHLVKSLSGSEKRYFKLFIGTREKAGNKYQQLFDCLDAQEEYDEEALREVVYGTSTMETRKFSELKSYLYDLILKALQGYDEKSSVYFKLEQLLGNARVLFRRGRLQEARQQVLSGKKLARQYEQFGVLLDLLAWEKQIAYAQTDIAWLDGHLPRLEEEEAEAQEAIQTINLYRNLFLKFLVVLRKDASLRGEKGRQLHQELLRSPLLREEAKPDTYQGSVQYHRVRSLVFYAGKDFGAFYRAGRDLLDQMEAQPHFLKEDVSEYISALSNYAFSCGWLKRYEEVEECLEKFRKIEANTLDDELKIHRQYYMNKLGLCIVQGQFQEGIRAMEQLQEESARFEESLFRKNTFYFQFFYIHFGAGNYQEALEYLNDWLNLSGNIERRDLQALARILHLVIHYEMGHTLLLESLLRSSYRFLKKNERMYEYERLMLLFFKTAIRLPESAAIRKEFDKLRNELEPLREREEEREVLELFDIVAWIDSKRSGIPFARQVQLRYKDMLNNRRAEDPEKG